MQDNLNRIFNALKLEIQKYGITSPETIQTDKLIRFSDNGKRNNKNGWYVLYINSNCSAGAAFGNWKDVNQKWFYTPNGKTLSKKEKEILNKQFKKDIKLAKQERREIQLKAAKHAQKIWEKAESAIP